MIFTRRNRTADVINAMSGSFAASLRVAQGRPPAPAGPKLGVCECGHLRGVHKPMKRFKRSAYGCGTCLCLTQPGAIEPDPRAPGRLSRSAWANFAAAVGAEGMGDVLAAQAAGSGAWGPTQRRSGAHPERRSGR